MSTSNCVVVYCVCVRVCMRVCVVCMCALCVHVLSLCVVNILYYVSGVEEKT